MINDFLINHNNTTPNTKTVCIHKARIDIKKNKGLRKRKKNFNPYLCREQHNICLIHFTEEKKTQRTEPILIPSVVLRYVVICNK